jgi:ankyrin repeat protein
MLGEIKLAHFSIKEYLVSDHLRTSDVMALSSFHLTDELSHSLISQTCLAYILQFDAFDSLYWFWDAIYPSSTPVPNLESTQPVNACNSELIRTRHLDYSESLPLDWDAIMSDFPLTLYAANHWIFHARSGDIDNSDPSLTLTLAQSLFAPGHAFFSWRQISEFRQGDTRSTIEQRASSTEPLYHAALAGLQRVSQHLLEKGLSDENGLGDALYAASSEGHEGIVKLLLAKGAVIYIDYALAAASRAGYEGIARLLLEKGADVNGLEDFHRDALYEATYNGHTAVVKLLLQEGAVRHINNALRVASQKGHETCVKLLLEKGADVNGQEEACKDHTGALQEASERGFETIVKLLLEKGADVNMQAGFYYGSGLYKASLNGHAAVVKLLLENGADIEGRQGDNGSPLYVASYSGHIAVVKLLLEKGAIVNAPGGYYGTALQAASNKSHISIVKLLLDSENAAKVTIHGNGNDNVLYTGKTPRQL